MIIFPGTQKTAWRDPTCFFFEGAYHLFCTKSVFDGDYMNNFTVHSVSRNLTDWSEPETLTECDRTLNYCSPGSVIEKDGEYLICLSSYPLTKPWRERPYADETARLFIMRTRDFKTFAPPEPLHPKGGVSFEEEGRMIDPFLMRDKDDSSRFLLFFKQNGVSLSESRDLVHWRFLGHADGGENACVLAVNNRYLLIHSPANGIGLKESDDLIRWRDKGTLYLNQAGWPWASGRLTAGFAMESRGGTRRRYILFFHGSRAEARPETHGQATLAAVFTDDFERFYDEP